MEMLAVFTCLCTGPVTASCQHGIFSLLTSVFGSYKAIII
jgi:hypothetical protein